MREIHVSVDRITLVGFKIDYQLSSLFNDITFDLIKNRYRAQYPYDWRYELVGGGVLEIGSLMNQSNMRVDFNPNSVSEGRHKDMFQKLIGCMKYVRPTRVDIAMDIENIDINDYTIIDDLSRKTNQWRSGVGKLETYYIGAPTADLRIRIYNKALEQGKEGKLWRIESQLRRDFAENYEKFNPFQDITLVRKDVDLSHIKNFNQKMTVKHLLEYPEDLSVASNNTRYKYKKILKELTDSNSKMNFYNVYQDYTTAIDNIVQDYIKNSRNNDVI